MRRGNISFQDDLRLFPEMVKDNILGWVNNAVKDCLRTFSKIVLSSPSIYKEPPVLCYDGYL